MFGVLAMFPFMPFLTFPTLPVEEYQQEIQEEVQLDTITHNWYATDSVIQDYVDYAYDIWGIDFVKLIECENWRRDPERVSKTHDHWLCQLNYKYNKKFINSSEFSDPYRQLDYCYEKYKINPDLRYWPDRWIDWKKCVDFVDDRFDITLT